MKPQLGRSAKCSFKIPGETPSFQAEQLVLGWKFGWTCYEKRHSFGRPFQEIVKLYYY